MRTLILIEVEHSKPVPALAQMVAGRAYTIDGVTNAEGSIFRLPLSGGSKELAEAEFSAEEIAVANRLAGQM